MDTIEQLFKRKTEEAISIVAQRSQTEKEITVPIPFEVNKVLNQIAQETERRNKVLKRKPT
jgi:transcriptional regulator of met regulon